MFIILPVGMNYETSRAPVVTFTLMGINVVAYLASLPFTLHEESDGLVWILTHLWLVPAQATWYSYLTAVFMHAGLLHLLGNMFYLFLFGCCVEDMIGRWRFLGFYLLSGIVGNLVYIGLIPDHFASELPLGGASGAISACMGAYLVLRSKVDIDFKWFALIFFRFFSGEFSLPAWVVISFWFLKDLFFALLGLKFETGGGGVAFGAHVGGFLMGAGLLGIGKLVAASGKAKPKAAPMRVHMPVAKTPAGPLDAPSAEPSIYVHQNETQYGPYNRFQIRQMLAEGSVTSDAQYWSEGMPEWRSVSELATTAALEQ
jgi:membrane associated rhomboid family serine protease